VISIATRDRQRHYVKIRLRKAKRGHLTFQVIQVVDFYSRIVLHRTETVQQAIRWVRRHRHTIVEQP
jgi:hypothetical protein